MPVGVGAKPAGGAAKPVTKLAATPAKPATPPSEPPAGSVGKQRNILKIVLAVVLSLVLLAGLAVGVLFALKALGILGVGMNREPTSIQSEAKLGKTTITTGEPININLKNGYLAFAATVYFDDTVNGGESGGDIDTSPARNAAYLLFKGMSVEELGKSGAIAELQEKYQDLLNKEVIPPYDGHVMAVRFTTFAYQ